MIEDKQKEINAKINEKMLADNVAFDRDIKRPKLIDPVYPKMKATAVIENDFIVSCSSSDEDERKRFDKFVSDSLHEEKYKPIV